MLVPQEVPFHEWRGGPENENRGCMYIPTLTCNGDPDPLDDRLTINFCSGIDNSPLESTPHPGGREVSLEEHVHLGVREVL